MKRVVVGGLLLVGILAGCGGSSTNDTTTGSGTMAISGSITVPGSRSMLMDIGIESATVCGDGYYYRVGCMAFSETLVAQEADVSCSGNTGSFTVSGLPTNTPIGCLLYRGTTSSSASLKYFAAIEVPSTGLSSTTDTIVGTGDVTMAVTVASDGTITATATGGIKDTTTASGSGIGITNGFYKMNCGTPRTDGTAEQIALDRQMKGHCRCFLTNSDSDLRTYCNETGGETWNTNHCEASGQGVDLHQRCWSDHGERLLSSTPTDMNIEANIYSGTVAQDTVLGPPGTPTTSAGTPIKGVSVWAASCTGTTCTSACGNNTTCGEEFPATAVLSWNGARARLSRSLNWATGDLTLSGVTLHIAALPSKTGTGGVWTVGDWQSWFAAIVTHANTNLGSFTCQKFDGSGTETAKANIAARGDCMAQFLDQVYRSFSENYLLPRIDGAEVKCYWTGSANTCLVAANDYRLRIRGIDFSYDQNWDSWNTTNHSQAAVLQSASSGPSLMDVNSRYVFEQWRDFENGGGTFTQQKWNNRRDPCTSSDSTSCPAVGPTNGSAMINCGINEVMTFKFIPTSTSGIYKTIINQVRSVNYAHVDVFSNTGTPSSIDGADAKTICETKHGITTYGNQNAEAVMTWLAAPVAP